MFRLFFTLSLFCAIFIRCSESADIFTNEVRKSDDPASQAQMLGRTLQKFIQMALDHFKTKFIPSLRRARRSADLGKLIFGCAGIHIERTIVLRLNF